MRRKYDVTLCGYYGFGNLGDELLARSIIDILKEKGIDKKRIALLSADPAGSSRDFGIDCHDRWDLRVLWRVLRQSETLLFGGGGIFQDKSSIRSCFYYWGLARLAGIAGAKLWMFGQSVGPLKSITARILARNAISGCVVSGVRDQGSMEILNNWGIQSLCSPDPVLSINPSCSNEGDSLKHKVLLVNLRPWGDDLPGKFVEELGKIDAHTFDEFVFVALAGEDEILANKLLDNCSLPGINTRVERVKTMEDIEKLWCRASAAIGMRLHFCILSFVFSVPCVAVPYDPKVSYFAGKRGMMCWKPGSPFPVLPCRVEAVSCGNSELKEEVGETFDRCLGIVLGAS